MKVVIIPSRLIGSTRKRRNQLKTSLVDVVLRLLWMAHIQCDNSNGEAVRRLHFRYSKTGNDQPQERCKHQPLASNPF